MKRFYKTNRYGKVLNNCKCCWVVEQNPKTKDIKDLSSNKVKAIVGDFFLNHINNSLIMQKIIYDIISPKIMGIFWIINYTC